MRIVEGIERRISRYIQNYPKVVRVDGESVEVHFPRYKKNLMFEFEIPDSFLELRWKSFLAFQRLVIPAIKEVGTKMPEGNLTAGSPHHISKSAKYFGVSLTDMSRAHSMAQVKAFRAFKNRSIATL